MPIEIKELHIHVTVNAQEPPAAGKQAGGKSGGEAGTDKEALIAECMEQVMQILQNKQER